MGQPALRLRSRSTIVIPARLASTRLPRKLLLRETGKTLLEHTWEAARAARKPLDICVAADDPRLVAEVERFGGTALLTDPACASGTDRVAEAARGMSDVEIVVNVQGDEPELPGAAIDRVIELLEGDPAAEMATLATPIRDRARLDDTACVKVVCDGAGRALYFSRSPIPAVRDRNDELLAAEPPRFLQHVGLYAYRRPFLLRLAGLPQTPLERLENLEQLRVLEHGHTILVGTIDEPTVGIDTRADYDAFVARVGRG